MNWSLVTAIDRCCRSFYRTWYSFFNFIDQCSHSGFRSRAHGPHQAVTSSRVSVLDYSNNHARKVLPYKFLECIWPHASDELLAVGLHTVSNLALFLIQLNFSMVREKGEVTCRATKQRSVSVPAVLGTVHFLWGREGWWDFGDGGSH